MFWRLQQLLQRGMRGSAARTEGNIWIMAGIVRRNVQHLPVLSE